MKLFYLFTLFLSELNLILNVTQIAEIFYSTGCGELNKILAAVFVAASNAQTAQIDCDILLFGFNLN